MARSYRSTSVVLCTGKSLELESTKAQAQSVCVCVYLFVCVCVFFPFILDITFVGRTSRGHTGGRSNRTSHPPFCGACLNFSREKDSAIPFPRVDREVDFCVLRFSRSPPVGHFYF